MGTAAEPLVKIRGLKKYYRISSQELKAVDGIDLDIYPGETVGLVGESGCGKSTVGKTLIRLIEATSGEITFEGENVFCLSGKKLKKLKRNMQIIFQDPYASLNPRMTVEEIIGEPLDLHKEHTGIERRRRIEELIKLVGLRVDHLRRFPHEFSGGQRQRIGIARALALNPKFLVCDEPISALDVSIQAQVVNLLKEIQERLNLTYLFIAHDLAMVKYISDRILVLYLGKMMELADSETLCNEPLHPYTQALMSSIPDPRPSHRKERIILEGEIPSPLDPPSGCVFRTRCRFAMAECTTDTPEWREVKKNHFVACHLYKN